MISKYKPVRTSSFLNMSNVITTFIITADTDDFIKEILDEVDAIVDDDFATASLFKMIDC